jgi:hypothetical protein
MKTERNAGITRPLVEIVDAETRVTGKIVTIMRREGVAGKTVKARIRGPQSLNRHVEFSSYIVRQSQYDRLVPLPQAETGCADGLTFAHRASHAAPTSGFSIGIIIDWRRPLPTVDASRAERACLTGG